MFSVKPENLIIAVAKQVAMSYIAIAIAIISAYTINICTGMMEFSQAIVANYVFCKT